MHAFKTPGWQLSSFCYTVHVLLPCPALPCPALHCSVHLLCCRFQDSKPWRLQVPVKVTWFDVDQPGVMQCKHQLLQEAGAALTQQPHLDNHTQNTSNTSPHHAASSQVPCSQGSESDSIPGVQFPLLVEAWRPVAADLSTTALASCLQVNGFDATVPTVWLAEALLYYLTLDKVNQGARQMAGRGIEHMSSVVGCW